MSSEPILQVKRTFEALLSIIDIIAAWNKILNCISLPQNEEDIFVQNLPSNFFKCPLGYKQFFYNFTVRFVFILSAVIIFEKFTYSDWHHQGKEESWKILLNYRNIYNEGVLN